MAKKKRDRTTEIMKGHTDRLINEGKVDVEFNEKERELTIYMNTEIIKYHRHRHTRWATYDPMDKYKVELKKLITEAMEEKDIVIPEEYMSMPIVTNNEYITTPVKSGNSLGKIALMFNNKIKRTKTPDIDNFAKTSYDVLNGVVWNDDNQIIESKSKKLYGREEGTILRIKYVPDHGYEDEESTDSRELLKDGIITNEDLELARSIKND